MSFPTPQRKKTCPIQSAAALKKEPFYPPVNLKASQNVLSLRTPELSPFASTTNMLSISFEP